MAVFTGCVQEMADQPRLEPLEASPVFADGRASRHTVPGTVARGELQLDEAYLTGRQGTELVSQIPELPMEKRSIAELLDRGQHRYTAICSHCHGQVGGGTGGSELMQSLAGMVVQRGFPAPPTFHQPRLREAPIGYFVDVMTNGFGRMPPHGYMIKPEDRWAIAAYIRALQLSQNASSNELQPTDLEKLNAPGRP